MLGNGHRGLFAVLTCSFFPSKLLGDYFDNRQWATGVPYVGGASNFMKVLLVSGDWNNRRIAGMTRKLERPESQNNRKPKDRNYYRPILYI
jgi:hypothetical protein